MGTEDNVSVLSSCSKANTFPKPGVVAHACNPNTWEAEPGGEERRLEASLSNLARLCFKIKNKAGRGGARL